ncbi:MAG: GNAT family N-acetyltransferase [Bacteroidales bacterium]|nr:GNAT family N-acetyltransferase [Bacteroidales bacterium]MBN2757717.1 GNAT family N-acetyltransferase [Bacteroidales bacterium]
MKFEIFTIKESKNWHEYINKLPENQQDIYFMPEYYNLYEKYGDGIAKCFAFEFKGEIALYPFLINKVDNELYELDNQYFDIQGAYGYNGVAASTYDEQFINEFYNAFSDFCNQNNIIAEFTRFHPLLKNHEFSKNHLKVIKDRQVVYLKLIKDIDKIWTENYSSNNRNMIRKSKKSNVISSVVTDENSYKVFYENYLNTMKAVNASEYYYFNEDYVLNFNSFLGKKQKLIEARYNNQVIGGMLLMLNGEFAHYHLSSRDRKFSSLAANNLVLDEAIKIAIESGAEYFHFGGGNSNNSDDPLFKFKANFSKGRADFYIGKKIHNELIYNRICDIWENKYPEKKEKFVNFLLKYKETN